MSICGVLFRRLADDAMAQCGLEPDHVCAHAEYRNTERPKTLDDGLACHPTLCAQVKGHVGSHDTDLSASDEALGLPPSRRPSGVMLPPPPAPQSYRDLANEHEALGYGPDDFGGSDFP